MQGIGRLYEPGQTDPLLHEQRRRRTTTLMRQGNPLDRSSRLPRNSGGHGSGRGAGRGSGAGRRAGRGASSAAEAEAETHPDADAAATAAQSDEAMLHDGDHFDLAEAELDHIEHHGLEEIAELAPVPDDGTSGGLRGSNRSAAYRCGGGSGCDHCDFCRYDGCSWACFGGTAAEWKWRHESFYGSLPIVPNGGHSFESRTTTVSSPPKGTKGIRP